MRNEINLTDEEIETRFDDLGYGVTMNSITFTRDTLDDFRSGRLSYAEPGDIIQDEDSVIEIRGAKSAKGQPRRDLVIVDFGTVRAVKL